MRQILFIIAVAASGCLHGGCKAMPVNEWLGISNPKVTITKNIFGFKAEAGTDFSGSLKADYDPQTGVIHLDGQVASDASGVVKAEGDRAVQISPVVLEAIKGQVEIEKARAETVKAVAQAIQASVVGGAASVAKMVEASTPILSGLSASLVPALTPPVVGPRP